MFIQEIKIKLSNNKANLKKNSYNINITGQFHIEVGHVIYNKESAELIFRDLNILDKNPYLQKEEIESFLKENQNELIFEYFLN